MHERGMIQTFCNKHFNHDFLPKVHFGSTLPLSFSAVFRAKFGDHTLLRKIALEGHRFTPPEALKAGIVDHIVTGDTDAVLAKAEEVAAKVGSNAKEGAWGLIKVCVLLGMRRLFRLIEMVVEQLVSGYLGDCQAGPKDSKSILGRHGGQVKVVKRKICMFSKNVLFRSL